MLKRIDDILNGITMYRLILYYLIFLLAVAAGLGYFGMLPYSPTDLLVSTFVIVAVCWVTNNTFAKVFDAPANSESVYITALILALIITPPEPSKYLSGSLFLIWASVLAMASKYILAIRKKHVFNPAAFAIALTAIAINESASWWAGGNLPMLPFVLVGGLLIVRKIQRSDLVISFLIVAAISIVVTNFPQENPFVALEKGILHAPLFFFAFIMVTEPLTTPPTKTLRICYGALVGLLFAPAIHVGSVYSTPELALILGNVFSYLVSPKGRYILKLEKKVQIAPDIYDFLFAADRKLKFRPGQYLEWTSGHIHPDTRGNRRYFTIASSPDENEVRIGVKFYPRPSSFKKSLLSMDPGSEIAASQLAGDFVLPRNKESKLVFMAGGIGITPFRSMIRHLLDRNEKRPIILLYSNRILSEVAYKDVFDEASERLGIKTVYTLTNADTIPEGWAGRMGRVDAQVIIEEIPDYRERMFYLSGPRSFVVGFEEVLKGLKIPDGQIKIDFFPGFA